MQPEQPALVTFMNDSRFGITSDNGSIRCNLTIMARPGISERETVNQLLHHLFNSIQEAVDESSGCLVTNLVNKKPTKPKPDQDMPSHESVMD